MEGKRINWLHLADWQQQGAQFERQAVVDALLQDLDQRDELDPALDKINFLVCSGDSAYGGKAEEYDTAKETFFEPLRQAVGLSRRGMFFVPGNHDMDLTALDKLPLELEEPFTSSAQVQDWLRDQHKRDLLLQPFAAYSRFVLDYPTRQVNPAYASVSTQGEGSETVTLLGLNSAWMSGRRRGPRGQLDDRGYALIGEPQVDDVLAQADSSARLVIAVLHHPIDWLAAFERERLVPRLYDRCHFILHSHLEASRAFQERFRSGECVVIGAGTSHARPMTARSVYAGTYNLVSLDLDAGRGTVYLRHWDERGGGWRPDTAAYEEGRFEFDLPKKRAPDQEAPTPPPEVKSRAAQKARPKRAPDQEASTPPPEVTSRSTQKAEPISLEVSTAEPPRQAGKAEPSMPAPDVALSQGPPARRGALPLLDDPLGRQVEVDGQLVPVKVWQGEGYGVGGPSVDDWPHVMWPDTWAPVHVRVENRGTAPWQPSGAEALQLGCLTWPRDPSQGPARAQRWSLDRSIPPGESLAADQEYTGPDKPGRYRVEWALFRGENPREVAVLRGKKAAIRDLEVVSLDELLDALPGLPQQSGGRQTWWIKAIGQAARQKDIDLSQRQTLIEKGLVPALFSSFVTARRTALNELAQFKRPDPELEALLRRTFDERRADLTPVAALLKDGRVPADAKQWLAGLLPAEEPTLPPGSEKPKPTPEPAATGAAGSAAAQPPAAAAAPGAAAAGAGPQPAGPAPAAGPIVQVVNLAIYEPPPPENRVIIEVNAHTVKLTYDKVTYSGPNRLDPVKLLEVEADPGEYGRRLFAGILHTRPSKGGAAEKPTLQGYNHALVACQRKVRVELILDPNDDELHRHRWEYLQDPESRMPLAVLEQSPFYRYVDGLAKDLFIKGDRRLKVLVAVCNPANLGQAGNTLLKDLAPLDAAKERTIVRDALQPLDDAGLVEYDLLLRGEGKAVTKDALREALQEDYHVLHLVAHGLFIQETGVDNYFLVMERADGQAEFVSVADFEQVVQAGNKLRLVVLASCSSALSDTGETLRGLGPRLVRETTVPAVIAMQAKLPIPTAQLFTQYFYDDLARSGRVDMAMAATRLALFMKEDAALGRWGIPVLLMSADDGHLLDVDQKKAAGTPKLEPKIRSAEQLGEWGESWQQVAAEARAAGLAQVAVMLEQAAGTAPLDLEMAPRQQRMELSARLTPGVALEPSHLKAPMIPGAGPIREEDEDVEGLRGFVWETAKLRLGPKMYAQIAASLNTGKHIILIGPPGTGKTSLASAICRYAEKKGFATGVALTTATADWTTFDTVGGYVPTPTSGQALQFRTGVFLRAICQGEWLVIDEINRAEIDKAFGELFTVVSGQLVNFPYYVGRDQVRVLPPRREAGTWIPDGILSDYDYVVHPNWRIVGTMNVYDKSSLFALSLAFMRRFAFIDVELPPEELYKSLCEDWITAYTGLKTTDADRALLRDTLYQLLNFTPEGYPAQYPPGAALPPPAKTLMARRALGPAIVKDMIHHIGHRRQPGDDMVELAAEAFLLYAAPQLDGLDREAIGDIYKEIKAILGVQGTAILHRIRDLYPYIDFGPWP